VGGGARLRLRSTSLNRERAAGDASKGATPPGHPARGQPRAGGAGSNRFATALVNRSRLQKPANAQALVRPKALRVEQPTSLTGGTATAALGVRHLGVGRDVECQRQSRSPSERPKTPPWRSVARGFAKKPTVGAARDPGPHQRAILRRKLGIARRFGQGLWERPAEAGGAPSSAPLSSTREAEEVERFRSGAREVGRLMHTSGRRILSAGMGGCREAPFGQAV